MITEWPETANGVWPAWDGAYAVSESVPAAIETQYPDVTIDWAVIDQALCNLARSPAEWFLSSSQLRVFP
jgi:hypothetical protein